jgi:hypothetical protein
MSEIAPVKPLLGTNRRMELEEDRDYLTKQLSNPLVQDKPMVMRHLRRIEHDIETQTPPELKGEALDKEVRLERELREEIVPNMLSQAEMRQAPAGSVGREIAFQKKFKNKILRWKNAMRTIHRDSEDPDLSNLERFRPVVSRGNLDNCFIKGKNFDFPSPQYQDRYDHIDWSAHARNEGEDAESFKSRVRREELASLRARLEALEDAITDPSDSEPMVDLVVEEEAPPRLGLEQES